ncbi:MAG: hypothetical protein ACREQ5_02795 [Candidatus Dormibacteria bacterium]
MPVTPYLTPYDALTPGPGRSVELSKTTLLNTKWPPAVEPGHAKGHLKNRWRATSVRVRPPGSALIHTAVEPGELADISSSGAYRVPEGIGNGKYFYPTQEQAANFARLNPGRSYTLTSGEFSNDVLAQSWNETIAREGSAYFIPSQYFPYGPISIGGSLP